MLTLLIIIDNKKISENKIAVTEADKGRAILIVTSELLRKKALEKLSNPVLHETLEKDPTKDLHKNLVDQWIDARSKGIVTAINYNSRSIV